MSSKKAVKDTNLFHYCAGKELYVRFCRTYIKVEIPAVANMLVNDGPGGERWLEIEVSQLSVYIERMVYNRTHINPEYKIQL